MEVIFLCRRAREKLLFSRYETVRSERQEEESVGDHGFELVIAHGERGGFIYISDMFLVTGGKGWVKD
jgi:hypothetical protein